MKSLKEQIEFIDTKLLVLYGFNGITDYTHSISMTDPELNKVDLVKLNELIPEFRKVFHAKNFSLHKTEYKIQTESQAVCLLKTCLEVTSIPFDVSLKKNKRTLRLISTNNILENYINTKKMSENGTFTNSTIYSIPNGSTLNKSELNPKMVIKPWISDGQDEFTQDVYSLKKIEPSPDTIVKPWLGSTIEPASPSQKEYQVPETITKEMLNDSIKTRISLDVSIGLDSKSIYQIHQMKKNILIDLKGYGLGDKSISSCLVKIKSKVIGGKPVISQEFIDSIVTDIKYELYVGRVQPVYSDNFVNGQDIISSNLIIVNKCIQYDQVTLLLFNLDKISNYLDMLEIELSVTHVKFYVGMENKLTSKYFIIQQIVHNGLYNDLRILHGLAGLAYAQNLSEQDYLSYQSGKIVESKTKYLDDLIEKSGAKVFKGFGIPSDLTGLELVKYDEELFKSVENGYITNKYDFITWTNKHVIPSDVLPYFKIILEGNVYVHCWDFPITGVHDTITDISIEIAGKEFNTFYTGSPEALNKDNNCLGIVFLDVFKGNVVEGKANADRWASSIKANSKFNLYDLVRGSLHLLTYGGIGYIRLKIHSNTPENPISGANINFSARFTSWNNSHVKKLQKQYWETNGFVDLAKLLPEKKDYDSIKTF